MTTTNDQAALQFDESSRKLHDAFAAWWAVNREEIMRKNPGVPEWQVELAAWLEFKKGSIKS
jgi:hypothetical protein